MSGNSYEVKDHAGRITIGLTGGEIRQRVALGLIDSSAQIRGTGRTSWHPITTIPGLVFADDGGPDSSSHPHSQDSFRLTKPAPPTVTTPALHQPPDPPDPPANPPPDDQTQSPPEEASSPMPLEPTPTTSSAPIGDAPATAVPTEFLQNKGVNPILAALLEFFCIVPIGYLMLGQPIKGLLGSLPRLLLICPGCFCCLVPWFAVPILDILLVVDVYMIATAVAKGESVGVNEYKFRPLYEVLRHIHKKAYYKCD